MAPHWWGVWKYEALGLLLPQSAWQDGERLAEIYIRFQERFGSDWVQLHIGTPRWFHGAEVRVGKAPPGSVGRLIVDPAWRALKREDRYFSVSSEDDEDITDFPDYLLGSRVRRPKIDLSRARAVDDFVRRYVAMSADEIEAQGYADHVRPVVRSCGGDTMVAVHVPSAVCEIFDPSTGYIGFEGGLIAFHDQPEGMRRLIERSYQAQLEWARAYARAGAHAFVISESYISPDLVHPSIYRSYLKGVHREYFAEVERMGLIPMCDFWGDVMPILDDLADAGIRGLLVEESKKGFTLPVQYIRDRLAGRVCLFGNIDSLVLLHDGSPQSIHDAVQAQAAGAGSAFVTANGSPITPGTPAVNVDALVDAGTKLRRYG